MQIIYARVSTEDQNIDQQVELLKTIQPSATVFADKATGSNADRPQFQAMVAQLRAGDSIFVQDISRLARNLKDLLGFIELCKDRGVSIHVHALGNVDITSPTGAMVVSVLGAVAQMQREEMLDKQKIGIARAKTEGRYTGRKQSQETIAKCEKALGLIQKGVSKEDAAKAAGVGVATLYRFIKANS